MKSNKSAKRSAGTKNGQGKRGDLIDVREAVKAAAEYFRQIYSDKQYSDLLVEEVELSETKKRWLITLSYAYQPRPLRPGGISQVLGFEEKPRKYKVFEIEAVTGKVTAMGMTSV